MLDYIDVSHEAVVISKLAKLEKMVRSLPQCSAVRCDACCSGIPCVD